MSWIFGTIDFSAYGVMVSKSSGVLDLPNLKTEGHNWMDEDGIDYWQNAPKYNDREIILNCWMMAEATYGYGGSVTTTGYENFKTKVAAFTAAVKAAGKVTFQTPYINIANCSISTGVAVTRETNYVQNIQAGTFLLRIKVHGDSDFNLVSVYNLPGEPTIVLKTRNFVYTHNLQGDEYIQFSVESNQKLSLNRFSWIIFYHPNETVNYKTFSLNKEPQLTKVSSNKYVYNLKFEQDNFVFIKTNQFLFDGEGDFDFYGNMEDIVDLFVTNSARLGAGTYSKGTVDATEKRNFHFTGESSYDVLKRIAAEYELEFELAYDYVSGGFIVNVTEFIGTTKSITLEQGQGNGLYELTRGEADTSKLCTVLYAYGAAKNLKPDYRNGLRRLSFDNNPLESNVSTYGRWEVYKVFDEIYPQRSATVTGYLQVLPPDLTDAEEEVYPGGIYVVGDSTLDFDLNDYLLGGLTAKIRMKTGDLAGYEFDIVRYDDLNKYIFIIPFKDERGYIVPNDTLMIQAGDEYTLVDIDQPSTYVATEEANLEAAAQDYIDTWSTPVYPYNAIISPAFIAANPTYTFNVGDRNTLVDTDFGINGLFRISQLTYTLNTGIIEVTYSDYKRKGKREQLEFRLQEIERALLVTKKDTVEVQRNDQQPTDELRRILLDPNNDKLNVDNIVRNNSLDPRHISYDAGTIQWSLNRGMVIPNVDGNEDKITFEAGEFNLHNYDGLSRVEIKKMKDLGQPYVPTRTWTIPETTTTLATKDNHYINIKLDLTSGSTDAEIEYTTEIINGKYEIEDNILRINLGTTGPGEETP